MKHCIRTLGTALLFAMASCAADPAFARGSGAHVSYPYVQASVEVKTPVNGGRFTILVHLHNTADLATSCVVEAGGLKKLTGVSAGGDADLQFPEMRTFNGVKLTCSVN